MIKKILLGFLTLSILIITIVLVRALRVPKDEIYQNPAKLIDVDADNLAQNLSTAIKFKTVTMQNRQDTNWEVFVDFQNWLKTTYGDFYNSVTSEQIATKHEEHEEGENLAQLNIWQGSDSSLNPIVFMAHMDVVPAKYDASLQDGWSYPPFDGVIKDGFVYGRGAIDDKGSLIAMLEAANRLAQSGYKPKRSLIFAFGHDEEIAGMGAKAIVDRLKSQGVKPYAVIDEGGAILVGMDGMPGKLAMLGVAEKGYLTLVLKAKARGGHSSTPPKKTAIGMLSKAIADLQAQPFKISRDEVMTKMLETSARRQSFSKKILLANLWLFGPLVESKLKSNDLSRAMMGTTIAPTIINAGIKENALPREATAFINFRIHSRDSIASVKQHVKKVINNPDIEISYGDNIGSEPSPISQIESGPYLWLKDVINQSFPDALVLPNTVVGGTDSRYFAAITNDIYRFAPYIFTPQDVERIHGLDERMSVEAFAKAVQVYYLMFEKAGG